jgi:hypothetical protein
LARQYFVIGSGKKTTNQTQAKACATFAQTSLVAQALACVGFIPNKFN